MSVPLICHRLITLAERWQKTTKNDPLKECFSNSAMLSSNSASTNFNIKILFGFSLVPYILEFSVDSVNQDIFL